MNINLEFKNLIPALSAEEYSQLEINILAEGIREPIMVWQDTIIDGHNRYEIATKHNLEYKTIVKDFDNKESVIDWMINNQLGRRNLSKETQSYLRGLQYEREKAKQGGDRKSEESKSYNTSLISTAERLGQQHNVHKDTIHKDAHYARSVDIITANTTPDIKHKILNREIEITKKDTEQLAKLEPAKQKEIIEKAIEQDISVKEATIAVVKPHVHVAQNNGNNEWYTPVEYIKAAYSVMGNIELDPATSEIANKVVKADKIYTHNDDSLNQEWNGNVWLNPPYAGELIGGFCNKLVESVNIGTVKNAIVLVNNATETTWFNNLVSVSAAIVFPKSRVKFYSPDGRIAAPLQGQAVLYIGDDKDLFLKEFSVFGWGATL